jgi:hypothetical protein
LLAFANSQTFIFFVIRPSDYGEFTLESSSPAEPSRVGPRGELDTGWGLRFLKFSYFRDGTLEFIIFFDSFRTRPPEARDRWLHAGPRGELDQGESSTWGWVFFFFLTLEISFFSRYDPPNLHFFSVRFELAPRTRGKCGSTTCPGTSSTPGRARARGGVFGCWPSLTLKLSFFCDKTL